MTYKYTRKEIVKAFENKLVDDDNLITYLLAKQEDKKEFTHKELSTPSPLDSLEKMEEVTDLEIAKSTVRQSIVILEDKINSLIRNQTKIINYLKQL